VQILFADAATGARSPALVHQGKIGEIIQAKPEQRRRVLEDAAGVAGLHARRHEAELRLKAAETNLTRVEDVVGQFAGQIEGLKKQARQAIRYREVAAKVRKAEATLYHLRWLEANAGVAETAQTHDLSVREMAERTREQAEAARIQAVRASELPALREAEARAAAGLQRLTNARETLDREEERAKDRVTELDRRLTQFSADIAREQQLTSDAEVALQRYVVANLDLVTTVDVSGFCSLLHLAQHLRENKRALAVVINDGPARDSLALMGLDFVCSNEATAVAAFHHLAILKELNRWPKAS